jgi:hypothetical protein
MGRIIDAHLAITDNHPLTRQANNPLYKDEVGLLGVVEDNNLVAGGDIFFVLQAGLGMAHLGNYQVVCVVQGGKHTAAYNMKSLEHK